MYTVTGLIQIDNDLIMENPSWEIASVVYDWKTNKANVEVHLKETYNVMSRTFTFDCDTSWAPDDAIKAILALPQFENSTAQ